MKNFEKYEAEIKKFEGSIALTDDGEIKKCCICQSCDNCQFGLHEAGETCHKKRVEWLYKEYREPLLTNSEKEYVRKYFLSKFIEKKDIKIGIGLHRCLIFLVNDDAYFSTSYMPECMISDETKKFKLGKYYTLEELGL